MGFTTLQSAYTLFGNLADCFNVTYIQRGVRHWLVFPGLLGLADDLALIFLNQIRLY